MNRRRLKLQHVRIQMGIIYEAYNPEFWWWELADLVEKLILCSCLPFFDLAYQCPIGMVVVTIHLMSLLRFSPYVRRTDDRLAVVIQCHIFLLLLIAYVLQQSAFVIGSFTDIAASVILFLVLGALFLLIIVNAFIFIRRFVRGAQRARAARNQLTLVANPLSKPATGDNVLMVEKPKGAEETDPDFDPYQVEPSGDEVGNSSRTGGSGTTRGGSSTGAGGSGKRGGRSAVSGGSGHDPNVHLEPESNGTRSGSHVPIRNKRGSVDFGTVGPSHSLTGGGSISPSASANASANGDRLSTQFQGETEMATHPGQLSPAAAALLTADGVAASPAPAPAPPVVGDITAPSHKRDASTAHNRTESAMMTDNLLANVLSGLGSGQSFDAGSGGSVSMNFGTSVNDQSGSSFMPAASGVAVSDEADNFSRPAAASVVATVEEETGGASLAPAPPAPAPDVASTPTASESAFMSAPATTFDSADLPPPPAEVDHGPAPPDTIAADATAPAPPSADENPPASELAAAPAAVTNADADADADEDSDDDRRKVCLLYDCSCYCC
jgi:hypothetical protein